MTVLRDHELLSSHRSGRFTIAVTAVLLLACDRTEKTRQPPQLARESRVVLHHGVRLHYERQGRNTRGHPPLLFLHGWGTDRRVFGSGWDELALERTLLFLDLPGHGESSAPEGDETAYTPDYLAQAALSVLENEGAENADLVAHNIGSVVALHMIALDESRVRSLILVDAQLRSLHGDKFDESPVIAHLRHPSYPEHREAYLEEAVVSLTPEPLRPLCRDMILSVRREALLGTLLCGIDPQTWDVARLLKPTLCILSSHPYWDADYRAFVKSRVRHLTLRTVSLDPFSLIQDSAWLQREFRAFLSTL